MRRKRKDGTYRHAYFYTCLGACGRLRSTFDHDRFLRKICTKDEEAIHNPAQAPLFPGV